MMKALKEAKIHSSWTEPHEEWENATRNFVAQILAPDTGRKFLRLIEPFVERLAKFGAANSLAQVVLKCTTPGLPDFYQGCELWDFSLVDPDNRRPVNYEHRRLLLASLAQARPADLLTSWQTGALKLFIIHRLLQLRREIPGLFRLGTYQPMAVSGPYTDRLIAFRREYQERQVAVIVPRLTAPLGFPAIGRVWKSTTVDLPSGKWRDIFSGKEVAVQDGAIIADLLSTFPLACLVSMA
jgi:(1->4)-alpha-D-glucan 1-alpha-D-glucosylmutase